MCEIEFVKKLAIPNFNRLKSVMLWTLSLRKILELNLITARILQKNPFLLKSGGEKYAAGVTKHFDFEGSMIEGVERSYRAFGAIQTPYFSITKTNSKAFRFLKAIRSIIK